MTNPDPLRTGLTGIAERVDSVDLYQRSLDRSRQIGRRRAAGMSAVAAVIAAVAVGSWQLLPGPDGTPVQPASPDPTATVPATPSAAPPTSPPAVPPAAPADLKNETLDVGTWPAVGGIGPCPTKRLAFKDGKITVGDPPTGNLILLEIRENLSVDVDGDGAFETVALLSCNGPGEGKVQQVVAYRGAPGAYTVVGQVVGQIEQPDDNEDTQMKDIEVSGRDVRVAVTNGPQGSAPPAYSLLRQWRTFRWNGTGFSQSAGSTSFLVDPAGPKVSVTSSALVFGKVNGSCRTGKLTLTVRNTGTEAAGDVSAAVMHRMVNSYEECPNAPATQGYESSLATVGGLGAGETRIVTVTVMAWDGNRQLTSEDRSWNNVELRVGDRRNEARVTFKVQVNN